MHLFSPVTLAALASASVKACCDRSPDLASAQERSLTVYSHHGPLNQSSLDLLRRFFDRRAASRTTSRPVLIFTSAGGDGRVALAMGDLIRANGADLVISGYCASYCAQAIIPSARQVTIRPHAVVVFHWSPSDIQLPITAAPSLAAELRSFREREDSFYRNRGIDPLGMQTLRLQVGPLCTIDNPLISNDRLDRYGTEYRFTGVTPTLEILRSIGLNSIRGYWPSSQAELTYDARQAGFNENFRVLFISALSRVDASAIRPPCITNNR